MHCAYIFHVKVKRRFMATVVNSNFKPLMWHKWFEVDEESRSKIPWSVNAICKMPLRNQCKEL